MDKPEKPGVPGPKTSEDEEWEAEVDRQLVRLRQLTELTEEILYIVRKRKAAGKAGRPDAEDAGREV